MRTAIYVYISNWRSKDQSAQTIQKCSKKYFNQEPAQHVLEVADDVWKRSDIAREHCPGSLLIHLSKKAAFLVNSFLSFSMEAYVTCTHKNWSI